MSQHFLTLLTLELVGDFEEASKDEAKTTTDAPAAPAAEADQENKA